MDRGALEQVLWLARRQHGAVHRDQVLGAGITRHGLAHAVRSGRWQRLLPQVYAPSSGEVGAWTWAAGGALNLGDSGAVARATAVAVHGLGPWPDVTELVACGRRALVHPRLLVHQTRQLARHDIVVVRGIRTTSPLRTLLDLSASLDVIALADLYALMLRRHLLARPQLVRRLAEHPRGSHTAPLREMVALPGVVDSGPELVLALALQRAGFRVLVNHQVRCPSGRLRRGDVVLPDEGIVVQVESTTFHSGVRGVPDLDRDADWLAAGYLTVRVPPIRIRRELGAIVADVRRATRMR